MISLINYVKSTQDVKQAEDQLAPIATSINDYWQSTKTLTTVALAIIIATSALLGIVEVYRLFWTGEKGEDPKPSDFARAYEINPNYARSYLGLGAVALQQAILSEPVDVDKLGIALDYYVASRNAPDQPPSAWLPFGFLTPFPQRSSRRCGTPQKARVWIRQPARFPSEELASHPPSLFSPFGRETVPAPLPDGLLHPHTPRPIQSL
jgi:hypothetical protein